MALITLNRRSYFIDCDTIEITPVSNGRWSVTYDRSTFLVVGGVKSGGAAHEWFCHHPLFYGDAWVPCGSMVQAIKLGVQY
jgi:hypothetical protein